MYDATAELQQLPALGEVVGDGDRVDRLTAAVQVDDRIEDGLVRRPVEIGTPKDLHDVSDRVLRQQHGAEHGLLSGKILRGRVKPAWINDGFDGERGHHQRTPARGAGNHATRTCWAQNPPWVAEGVVQPSPKCSTRVTRLNAVFAVIHRWLRSPNVAVS